MLLKDFNDLLMEKYFICLQDLIMTSHRVCQTVSINLGITIKYEAGQDSLSSILIQSAVFWFCSSF